jgi:hypothetical protein
MASGSEPSQPPDRARPQVRASDAERHEVIELLSQHAGAGRLTLAELEERVDLAYAARTRDELAELTRDLPASAPTTAAPGAAREPAAGARKVSRWFVAILGGSTHRGRRRLSGQVNSIAILGGDNIDLREAEIEGDELVLNVLSFMGGTDIYVPDSIEIEVSGFAIFGGNDERGSQRRARPGAPLIRIRSFNFMGGATVWRIPAEARGLGLKEARRAAKAAERGSEID